MEEKDINEIKTTIIDEGEYYLVPTDEYELVDESVSDEETDESNDPGFVAGVAATAAVGLLGFGIVKLVNAIKNRKKKKATSVDADYIVDSEETTEVIETEG